MMPVNLAVAATIPSAQYIISNNYDAHDQFDCEQMKRKKDAISESGL